MPDDSVPVGAGPTPDALADILAREVDAARVLTRPIERIAYASDASFYRLIPQAVVLAKDVEEIRRLFRVSRDRRIPLTFRAAGTSLSGQAVSDGLLVEVAKHWRKVEILDGGRKIRVQPGVIGGQVNAILRPYRAIERFWTWSDERRLPVVVDTSPCTYGLLHGRSALTPDN
jgi:FAD/FMN-containing dehydrogenase